MKTVQKAVILTAGLGTRFFPMTKVVPKAMLPILNKPVIQYLVEEALSAGIKEIIIVTGSGKRTIEEHFDPNYELERDLVARGKKELLQELQEIEKTARFVYVPQNEAHGDGHALLCAKELLQNEPFAVLFGDDIVDGPTPALTQLLEAYTTTGTSVLSTQQVPREDISSYGVIGIASQEGKLVKIGSLVEKPRPEEAPSNYALIGKYICTPEVLEALSHSSSSQPDQEIRLIDGFRTLLSEGKPLYAVEIQGNRYDTGTSWGLLEANLAFAQKDPELREHLKEFLKKL